MFIFNCQLAIIFLPYLVYLISFPCAFLFNCQLAKFIFLPYLVYLISFSCVFIFNCQLAMFNLFCLIMFYLFPIMM